MYKKIKQQQCLVAWNFDGLCCLQKWDTKKWWNNLGDSTTMEWCIRLDLFFSELLFLLDLKGCQLCNSWIGQVCFVFKCYNDPTYTMQSTKSCLEFPQIIFLRPLNPLLLLLSSLQIITQFTSFFFIELKKTNFEQSPETF